MEMKKMIALSNTPGEIVLERQWLFCKVIEQSAWRFCYHLKPYKPLKKLIKKVDMPVVTIGFPIKMLDTLIPLIQQKGFEIVEEQEGRIIRIRTKLPDPEESFIEWKNKIPFNEKKHINESKNSTNENNYKPEILARIKSYPLASRTPVETMQFVLELQKELSTIN